MGADVCHQTPCRATSGAKPTQDRFVPTCTSDHADGWTHQGHGAPTIDKDTYAHGTRARRSRRVAHEEQRAETGGDTVPLTTEVIGDLRRGRLPRYRCWMSSRSSHIPVGNVAWRREPTYASKNRTKPHAHVAGQWVPTYASKHHVEPQAARSRPKTVSSPHTQDSMPTVGLIRGTETQPST